MQIFDKNNIFINIRKKFQYFIFENYHVSRNDSQLTARFFFNLSDKYFFEPEIIIPFKYFFTDNAFDREIINDLVFHIGMVELISYWKAACPPEIIIKPRHLNETQVKWWKKLYYNGLGEFFYTNKINISSDTFAKIYPDKTAGNKPFSFKTKNRIIVPVGGGKDSVVTLELLKKAGMPVIPFMLNPRNASLDCAKKAGFSRKNIFEVHRAIHPQLLELNKKGFLNGHTPFSALLAFISLLAAYLNKTGNIALSNEASANEPTVRNSAVNHQYSKSFEFEKDFRDYVSSYISEDFNYFSFLRPLSEFRIAGLFSGFHEYHNVFRSCNAGSKTDSWCGKCPKCLFTWIILSPFLEQEELKNIFNKDLFNDTQLIPVFEQLIGLTETKPFECVGAIDEINSALAITIRKLKSENLPHLLKYYFSLDNYKKYKNTDITKLQQQFNFQHFLSPKFETIIKNAVE